MNRLGLRTLTTSAKAPKTTFAHSKRPNRVPIPVASLSTTTSLHVPSSSAPSSAVMKEPTPPQLPPRRRPQFAAAGFGLGGSHTVGGAGKLGMPVAAVPVNAEVEGEAGKDDLVDGLEGAVKSGSNEAEACYVVSRIFFPFPARHLKPRKATTNNTPLPPPLPPPPHLLPAPTAIILNSLRNMGNPQRRPKQRDPPAYRVIRFVARREWGEWCCGGDE